MARQPQIHFSALGETEKHLAAAREIRPELANANSELIRALIEEWYQFIGWNHDQLADILHEAAEAWPELASSEGLLLRKIAVEWSRNRGDARRSEIAERLKRIEEGIAALQAQRVG